MVPHVTLTLIDADTRPVIFCRYRRPYTVADRPVQGLDTLCGVAMTAAVWAHVEMIDANDFAMVFFIFSPSDEPVGKAAVQDIGLSE